MRNKKNKKTSVEYSCVCEAKSFFKHSFRGDFEKTDLFFITCVRLPSR